MIARRADQTAFDDVIAIRCFDDQFEWGLRSRADENLNEAGFHLMVLSYPKRLQVPMLQLPAALPSLPSRADMPTTQQSRPGQQQ